MPMASHVNNITKLSMVDGIPTANIGAMLVNDDYVEDPDHDFLDDVVASETSGTARITGLPIVTARDDANDRATYDSTTNPTFVGVPTQTPQQIEGIQIYDETPGTDATRTLIAYDLLAAPIQGNGSDIQVTFDAIGILSVENP